MRKKSGPRTDPWGTTFLLTELESLDFNRLWPGATGGSSLSNVTPLAAPKNVNKQLLFFKKCKQTILIFQKM